ncbi:uncharacterized protein LOC107269954 isoform X1 [Cephus cinctus]|uniref:Uncharacterized protein LOC107269954 isoform X1 n=1 Tax=Cephus cinctus TaxID=211228 RepID=A0AAJ7C1U1_CEPCN|nr:uncharacterized protein LOC107269954 isoform X1 [Cephus cinctus]
MPQKEYGQISICPKRHCSQKTKWKTETTTFSLKPPTQYGQARTSASWFCTASTIFRTTANESRTHGTTEHNYHAKSKFGTRHTAYDLPTLSRQYIYKSCTRIKYKDASLCSTALFNGMLAMCSLPLLYGLLSRN